jgi:prolyl-tRNA synthetase
MADADVVQELTKAPVGFAGPMGLKIPIIVDPEVAAMVNFVTGANKTDTHLLNVNIGREFKATATVDIKNAPEGEGCPKCDGQLKQSTGIEVGNTFMLGTKYSASLGGKYLDANGEEKPYIMGSYGIGITRTAQAAIEKYHDDRGIIWPKAIAPYQILLSPLNLSKENQREAAENMYSDLRSAGFEVLYDDRLERAGVKLNDADLIGIPLRIAVGDKSLAKGQVELKLRCEKDFTAVELDKTGEKAKEFLARAF